MIDNKITAGVKIDFARKIIQNRHFKNYDRFSSNINFKLTSGYEQ